jgi:hypothetical protein
MPPTTRSQPEYRHDPNDHKFDDDKEGEATFVPAGGIHGVYQGVNGLGKRVLEEMKVRLTKIYYLITTAS